MSYWIRKLICRVIRHDWRAHHESFDSFELTGRKCRRCDHVIAWVVFTAMGECDELQLRSALEQCEARIEANGGTMRFWTQDTDGGELEAVR